jgi:hypothetical protein
MIETERQSEYDPTVLVVFLTTTSLSEDFGDVERERGKNLKTR